MSIIHEALKKVEASGMQAAPSGAPVQKRKPGLKIALIYAAVAVLGFLAANMIFSFLSAPAKAPAQKALPPPPVTPPLPPPPVMQEEKKEPPQLTLNGIFFSGKEGYALINNQIVREGDRIGEATVEKISMDGVDLKYDETAVNLSNQAK